MIAETFVLLLLAHLVADFPLQPERMAVNKRRIPVLTAHVAIHAATILLVIGYWNATIVLTIAVTHFAIDFVKSRVGTFNLPWFLGDQSAHVAVVAAVAIIAPADLTQSAIYRHLTPDQISTMLQAMALASGFIVIIWAGTFATGLFLKPRAGELGDGREGLDKGGQTIGRLERFLVFGFAVSGNPAGIGFLIAAKSILMIGGVFDRSQRKTAEYTVIGTFFSFSWAIGFSLLALWAAQKF